MIPLYGCAADTPELLRLDHPDVFADEDEPMAVECILAPIDFGAAGGFGTLRRIVQSVALTGPCTITITPMADGSPHEDQTVTLTLDPAQGAEQILQAPVMVGGTRFSYRIRVIAWNGTVAFGESDRVLVPRRSIR